MGRVKNLRKIALRNVCFSLEEKQIKTLWKLVEQNGFTSRSEMMREIVRDYINKTINFSDSMDKYIEDYNKVEPIDHRRFKRLINAELRTEVIAK